MPRSDSSQSTPAVTWAPWNPVSVKKEEPKRFVLIVSPSCTNEVNSYAWKPRKVEPASAVIKSQSFEDASLRVHQPAFGGSGRPLFCTAASASTMNSEDISSTNVDIEVTGMFRIGFRTCPVAGSVHFSCGNGPTTLRPL